MPTHRLNPYQLLQQTIRLYFDRTDSLWEISLKELFGKTRLLAAFEQDGVKFDPIYCEM